MIVYRTKVIILKKKMIAQICISKRFLLFARNLTKRSNLEVENDVKNAVKRQVFKLFEFFFLLMCISCTLLINTTKCEKLCDKLEEKQQDYVSMFYRALYRALRLRHFMTIFIHVIKV